ncbi:Ubiquitin conjugation factor E4 B [Portunus trituberculatus]|uniref:Ubiquitin conjugation factor E4 B n=1 Tax=Portunus trituberculatus TaxID=210409 RepID=A0A5B7D9L0_PORTR|nr:Ubiquitin conjugation factor E4 B [Portunus trituberculatus]
MVVQARLYTSQIFFNRLWRDYKLGFGVIGVENWFGLEDLYTWTNAQPYNLRIDLVDAEGRKAYVKYDQFFIEGEDDGYKLHVNGYSGTAGNAFGEEQESKRENSYGMKFSTVDRDNDNSERNCADDLEGGWWVAIIANQAASPMLDDIVLMAESPGGDEGVITRGQHLWKRMERQIRKKRLAKLGATPTASTNNSEESTSPQVSPSPQSAGVTSATSQQEVTSQVLVEVVERLCGGDVPSGLLDPGTNPSDSPELSASPTGSSSTIDLSSIVKPSQTPQAAALSYIIQTYARCNNEEKTHPKNNWQPRSESQTIGREMVQTTLLGPFLVLSLFAEDDPRVAEQFVRNQGTGQTMPTGLQDLAKEMDHMRMTILHKLFHSMLVNTGSREPVLSFLARMISLNHRRAQIHVEEQLVAGDGAMVNLVSVLQQLCFKVSSFTGTSKDFKFLEVNFHSQCWFLTLHAHHLGVLPVMRKYTRRIRAIRDLQKMVEEIESTESQWGSLSVASKQRELLKKWKAQLKVLVESTGTSSEFYDKFTIRYHISVIFKSLWDDRRHRQALITESNSGKEFVKFVNLLMNDTTFLLDESLDALKRIHEVQEEMERGTWAQQSREQQQSRQRLLATDERQCRSYLTLARETVDMMHYLTKEVPDPFLRPELCDRLAAMLNFNLAQLCGQKCGNLKVRQADKYGWEPRKLLEQLVDIYLHLDSPKFHQAIANDEVGIS